MIEWRPLDSRYEVSSTGKIRSILRKRVLRQYPNHNGYMRVKLDGRWCRVHLLVLRLFSGPRPSERHIGAHAPDRNKRNNRISNLRWALPEENEADKKPHGTARGGVGRPLTADQVADIRSRAARSESFSSIAKVHQIHRYSVSRIVRGLRRAS